MRLTRRLLALRLLLCALVLPLLLAHCESFRLKSRERDKQAETAEQGDEDEKKEAPESETDDEDGKDKDKPEKEEDDGKTYRYIAVDQTPFFRWLRSGLRNSAKPTRFLDKGIKVEFLKEKEEEKFSQVRLPDRKKGWVPTRLLKESPSGASAPSPASDPDAASEDGGANTPEPKPSLDEDLPSAPPAELPIEPQPTLSSDQIGQPLFPSLGISQPKRRPLPKKEEAAIDPDPETSTDSSSPSGGITVPVPPIPEAESPAPPSDSDQ